MSNISPEDSIKFKLCNSFSFNDLIKNINIFKRIVKNPKIHPLCLYVNYCSNSNIHENILKILSNNVFDILFINGTSFLDNFLDFFEMTSPIALKLMENIEPQHITKKLVITILNSRKVSNEFKLALIKKYNYFFMNNCLKSMIENSNKSYTINLSKKSSIFYRKKKAIEVNKILFDVKVTTPFNENIFNKFNKNEIRKFINFVENEKNINMENIEKYIQKYKFKRNPKEGYILDMFKYRCELKK